MRSGGALHGRRDLSSNAYRAASISRLFEEVVNGRKRPAICQRLTTRRATASSPTLGESIRPHGRDPHCPQRDMWSTDQKTLDFIWHAREVKPDNKAMDTSSSTHSSDSENVSPTQQPGQVLLAYRDFSEVPRLQSRVVSAATLSLTVMPRWVMEASINLMLWVSHYWPWIWSNAIAPSLSILGKPEQLHIDAW